jgi:hypothetical protein
MKEASYPEEQGRTAKGDDASKGHNHTPILLTSFHLKSGKAMDTS